MRKPVKWTLIGLGIFIGVVIVAAIIIFVCVFVSAGVSAIKEVSTPETKQVEQVEEEDAKVTVENIKVKGGCIPLGEPVEYDGLKVTVIDCEASYFYENEEGIVYPQEGAKFIWIYVKAKNVGKQEKWLTSFDDFYLLHIGSFISCEGDGWMPIPFMIGREGYWFKSVMPGVSREGWISFEVPKGAKAEDILVALECDYDEYYYWEVPEPLKEASLEAETKEVSKTEEEVTVSEERETREEPEEKLLTLGQTIEYGGLRVSVLDYKFTDTWESEDYGIREPEEGAKYVWIYAKAENIGEDLLTLPGYWNFEVVYKERGLSDEAWDFGPIKDEPTYVGGDVYPGYGSEGWLIYEIYKEAKPEDIKVELSGGLFFSFPTYIWKLEE